MMPFTEVKKQLARMEMRVGPPTFRECHEAIEQGLVHELSPSVGRSSVREASATLQIRLGTTRAAGKQTSGFEETIEALDSRPPTETVYLYHLKGLERLYTVFVSSHDNRLLGCIRVTRDIEGGSRR